MKKSKSKAEKNNTRARSAVDNRADSYDLSGFGLEPPKIYREAQRSAGADAQRKRRAKSGADSENLTRAQKRHIDTKKRKKKVRLRKWVKMTLGIVAIVLIAAALLLVFCFKINTITVTGSKAYKADKILSQCVIEKGDNLFFVDTKSAAEKIQQNLPYVYKAEFKRKIPNTLQIVITDAKAAYSLESADKTYVLLDRDFKVLELGAQKQSGIKITNAEIKSAKPGYTIELADADVAACLKALSAAVKNNNFSEITEIYSKNVSENYAVYDNRITLKLGNTKDLESKLYKAFAACENLNSTNPGATGTMTVTTDKQIYFTEK